MIIEFLQYKDEGKYKKFIKSTKEEFNKTYSFPMTLKDIQIIGVNILVMYNSGIVPLILYKTETELKREPLKNELDDRKKLWEILDGLFETHNFTAISFRKPPRYKKYKR